MQKTLKILLLIPAILVLVVVSLFVYWFLRPNRAQVDYAIVRETWAVVDDGAHNSNTDMIAWDDAYYLAYVSSPYHFGSDESVMHVARSYDQGRSWEEVAEFNPPDEDIRDPKFAAIGDRLFLYALQNTAFLAEPYLSVYSFSDDGEHWTEFESVPELDGWLFWRPISKDGEMFYNAAYWYQHGEAILIQSTDGIHWQVVSTINTGERNDETEIEFLPNGWLIATGRLEYGEATDAIFGDRRAGTLIAVAEPPYTTWVELLQSHTTRLDGPYLFTYTDRVYAAGRYQPNLGRSGPLTAQGSALARKRTALFEVRQGGLAYLTDLPSSGDTSYVGLVVDGDNAYMTYYTSPLNKDYPWFIGMLLPTQIRMAQVDLLALEALADQVQAR